MPPIIAADKQEKQNESDDLLLPPPDILDGSEDEVSPDDEQVPSGILSESQDSSHQDHLPFDLVTETSFSAFQERHNMPVPTPDSNFLNTQFIQAVDLDLKLNLFSRLDLQLSDKVYYAFEHGRDIDDHSLLNDLREIYLSGSVGSNLFVDLGRINFKNGIAVGYNPTDYFKTDAISANLFEQDAVKLRENRIGVLAMRGQYLTDTYSLSMTYAPKISDSHVSFGQDKNVFGLGLADLNETHRFLTKLGLNLFDKTKTEFLFYSEDDQWDTGANISKGFGNRIIAYLEWNGSNRTDVISDAAKNYAADGTNDEADFILQTDTKKDFYHQVAAGFSFSEDIHRTTYFEYHYNQAGLSGSDWEAWFNRGQLADEMLDTPQTIGSAGMHLGQLWSVRKREIEEPLSQHELFIRTEWNDSFTDNLDFYGILKIDLVTNGYFFQPRLEYQLSDVMGFTFSCNFNLGASHSSYGSLPYSASSKIEFDYYF
jgi:hypothetical protein